ncbi:MAG: type II toxin-antitoxin system prevent-host-death family antitoxin [Ignavibacteria bacterium]|nr:type II toxin-antitoxin system prevent-host-death family antitoxin [Ignavibacteria bacterium]
MKLNESDLLVGKTETITAMDLRRGPGDILTQVSMGKTFIITRNGKPIATLTRPEEQQGLYLISELHRRGILGKGSY